MSPLRKSQMLWDLIGFGDELHILEELFLKRRKWPWVVSQLICPQITGSRFVRPWIQHPILRNASFEADIICWWVLAIWSWGQKAFDPWDELVDRDNGRFFFPHLFGRCQLPRCLFNVNYGLETNFEFSACLVLFLFFVLKPRCYRYWSHWPSSKDLSKP